VIEVESEVGTVQRMAPGGGTYVIRDFLCIGSGEPVAGDDAADARFVTASQLRELPTSEGLVEALEAWNLLPADLR
jgi:hypothetical protein